MRQVWSPEELVECWTLVEGDWPLVGNKGGATWLGFALLLQEEDRRGLSPLFWAHINPYGRFRLDMDTRFDLAPSTSTSVSAGAGRSGGSW